MTTQDQELCERCREHPATIYTCDGNTGESKSLCEQCYRESASQEDQACTDRLRDMVRNAKCKYCGAPSETGSGSFSSHKGEHFDLLKNFHFPLFYPSSSILCPSLPWSDSQTNFFNFPSCTHFSPTPHKHWRLFIPTTLFRPSKNRVFRQNPVSQKRELSIYLV